MRSFILGIMTLALTGCATDTRFQKLADHLGASRPWLRPRVEAGQALVQEGVYPFARTRAHWGLDLECGAYLTESETVLVYNIINNALCTLKLHEIDISVTDAQGHSLPYSPKSTWKQPSFLAAGGGLMGSEVFVGVPSSYPVAITWRLADGREMRYTFDSATK